MQASHRCAVRRLLKGWIVLLLLAGVPARSQTAVGHPPGACAELRAYVEGQRSMDAECVYDSIFTATSRTVGCYALYFSRTPCGNVVPADPAMEPQTQADLVFYNTNGTLESMTFDTLYQEGDFAAPALIGTVQKGSRSGFVVLYEWPQRHFDITGSLYQAVVYLFDTRRGLQIIKNDRLFKTEFDGYRDGKKRVVKYKTLRAIRQKIAASPL